MRCLAGYVVVYSVKAKGYGNVVGGQYVAVADRVRKEELEPLN